MGEKRGPGGDPFEVLGVARDAGEAELRAALRAMARELHPDRHRGDPRIEERFKRVVLAYEQARAMARGAMPWASHVDTDPAVARSPVDPHTCIDCGDGIAFPGRCSRCDVPVAARMPPAAVWMGPSFLLLAALVLATGIEPAGLAFPLVLFGAVSTAAALHDRWRGHMPWLAV